MSAAMKPPAQSPARRSQVYFPNDLNVDRSMSPSAFSTLWVASGPCGWGGRLGSRIRRRFAGSLRCHHFLESGLELHHLVGGANGDADVGGHGWPDATDIDLLLLQRDDGLCAGSTGVDHEAVRYRGNKPEIVLVEEAEGVFADLPDEFAAGG